MSIDAVIDALLMQSAYPVIARDQELVGGIVISQPPICRECPARHCVSLYKSEAEFSAQNCYRGVGTVAARIGSNRLVLNGLNLDDPAPKLRRALKRKLTTPRTRKVHVRQWVESLNRTEQALSGLLGSSLQAALGMFHDVQTSVSAILRSAERMVAQQSGGSSEQKFESLSPTQQSLIKATELLHARLKLMPLLVNPAAAAYGQKRARPIHAVIESLVRALRPVAATRRIQVKQSGRSFNSPAIYDSFETVPLVILENAIKYSAPDQSVDIEIEDVGRGVRISISSFSPYIAPDERQKIFESGYRGTAAMRVADAGSGLGLHLARIVADAHGFRLLCETDERDTVIGGIRYCSNAFVFTVA